MTTSERYKALATQWDAGGRPADILLGGYSLIALRCWTYSEGAKTDGVGELLREFVRASEVAQRSNWLDAYFSEQETCRGCGESYRFENISVCTSCSRTYCYRCKAAHLKAANGNAACPCSNGELVG